MQLKLAKMTGRKKTLPDMYFNESLTSSETHQEDKNDYPNI